jgi:hypothetical protein
MSKRAMSLNVVFTKFSKVLALAGMIAPAVLLAGSAAWGGEGSQSGREAGSDRAIRLVTLAPVPKSGANTTGGMYSFDISFVDQATQMYYLGDRSNAAVDVVDAKTGVFAAQFSAVPAFAGAAATTSTSGPNGVVAVTIGKNSFLFVTDANSRVVSMNAKTGAMISDVRTAAADPLRADELAFDPRDNLLLVINNADSPPFGTFIKVNPATGVLTPPTPADRLTLDTIHSGVDATNGAEQPVWEPDTGRFYLSIPQIGPTVSNGGVVRINPMSKSVEATIPVQFCGPAGLTVGPRQDLFVGCNMVFDTAGNVWTQTDTVPADPRDVIIDAKTGKKDPTALDSNVFGVGAGDEVWYNAGDGNYYATGSGSPMRPLPSTTAQGTTPLGVVDARDQRVLQLVATFNVPVVTTGTNQHPGSTAHSVAANADNNLVFVPLGANNVFLNSDASKNCLTGCIAVFGHPDEDGK